MILDKMTLANVLKIMKNYLTAALAPKVAHIYKIIQYTRLVHINIDNIDYNLKESDRENEALAKGEKFE